jgi:uncharacterized membrane protein YraQ (UPF0718 family)
MSTLTDSDRGMRRPPWGWLVLGFAAWTVAYASLIPFADGVIDVLGLSRDTHLGEAVHFFLYDTPKVLLLLTGIVFLMGVVHTFVSPERTRAMLSGKRLGVGNVMAASLGIVHSFLFLFGGAAVHRLPLGRRAAGRHLLLPDLGADGE